MSAQILNVTNINENYYRDVGFAIVALNYNNPFTDNDPRQREIMDYCKDRGIKMLVKPNHDFDKNMRNRSDKYYSESQPRWKSEDQEKIDYLIETIHQNPNGSQNKIIFGTIIEGVIYIIVGNHRAEAIRKAIRMGIPCNEGIVLLGEGLSDNEKRLMMSDLSAMGNKEIEDNVLDEDEKSIRHWLIKRREIVSNCNPSMDKWDNSKWFEWGKAAIINSRPHYAADIKKHRLGRMVNKAFGIGVEQSHPFPDDSEIAFNFKKYFKHCDWDPTNEKTIAQGKKCTNLTSLISWLDSVWDESPAGERKEVWLTVRVGHQMDAAIEKKATLISGRETFIKNLEKRNKCPRRKKGEYPLITKILFVSQMESDSYEAWEWHPQKKKFFKVKQNT